MPDRKLLTQRQVAARLGITLGYWHRRKAGLLAKHRFPPPVAGLGLRWDPVAIDRWLDALDLSRTPRHRRANWDLEIVPSKPPLF